MNAHDSETGQSTSTYTRSPESLELLFWYWVSARRAEESRLAMARNLGVLYANEGPVPEVVTLSHYVRPGECIACLDRGDA